MQMPECVSSNVLLIYRVLIPSVRLCAHAQLEYLSQLKKISYRYVQESMITYDDMNWANIVVLGRLDSWYELQLAERLKKSGRYLIYIIDDDLLNVPDEVSSSAYYGQDEIRQYILSMIRMSDAIISPSPILLKKYIKDGQFAIQIEEPAINPVNFRRHLRNQPVKIGFAGSVDRVSDLQSILSNALRDVHDQYGSSVKFEFFGAIPSFADSLNAEIIPYCESYEDYRNILNQREWDIGLAPLPDTPFHACKHYNKFCEYAAAGTVGIFSDEYPYSRLRKFDQCYLLCENTTNAWISSIKQLVDNRNLLENYRQKALQIAYSELSIEESATVFMDVLEQIQFKAMGNVSHFGIPLIKAENIIRRIKTKVNAEGFSGITKALKKRVMAK